MDHFLVAGSAQSPKNTNLHDVYFTVSVQFYVNKKTRIVEQAHANVISPLTDAVFQEIVTGYCMDDPIEPLLDSLKEHLLTPSTGSIIQATRSAWTRYRDSQYYEG